MRRIHRIAIASIAVLATPGCRQTSDLYCDSDADCIDLSRPYCDLEGVTAASNGIGHTCVPAPGTEADGGADGSDGGPADAGVPTQVTVITDGEGTGRVTSTPPGIDCGTTCSANFPRGTLVELRAEPDSGSHLQAWSGGCTGADRTCSFGVDTATTVTASFRLIRVTQVAAGGDHTCVLLDTGAVRCWGVGSDGQLGYGNTFSIGDDETPSSAGDVPIGRPAVQISAGAAHTCAVLDTAAVRCWGNGLYGRLGYGNTDNIGDDETPESAGDVNVGGEVSHVAAGGNHTCARLKTGAVRCWGRGLNGRLGYANEDNLGDDEAPASAGDVNVGAYVVQVTAGAYHTCALLDTDQIRCWGSGSAGRLGYGDTNDIGDDETPASAGDVFIDGNATAVRAGADHTCALLGTTVRCWGVATDGQLGYGNTFTIGDDESPAAAGEVAVGGAVAQVSGGGGHTCARLTSGAVRCWGAAWAGQLGYGNVDYVGDDEDPLTAGDVPLGDTATDIATGDEHTCAVLTGGAVRCWGWGFRGRLGYGNEIDVGDDETPAAWGDVPLF